MTIAPSPRSLRLRRASVMALLMTAVATAPARVLALQGSSAAQPRTAPRAVLAQAVDAFEHGRVAESVGLFDQVVTLAPEVAPHLWQRGIALYYAGRYRDCREQFEAHRTVNPNDVENAAWHFLCVARDVSVEAARAALLPVGPDARVPMRQVYEMFKGTLAPDAVLAAGGSGLAGQFFSQLYVGLYYEAVGEAAKSRASLSRAAADRFEDAGGYMHMVARVHVSLRQASAR